jgi:acylphosphatase
MTIAYSFGIIHKLTGGGAGSSPISAGAGLGTFPILTGDATAHNYITGSFFKTLECYGSGSQTQHASGNGEFKALDVYMTAGGNATGNVVTLTATGTGFISSKADAASTLAKLTGYGEGICGQVGRGVTNLYKLTSDGEAHLISIAQGAGTFPILECHGLSLTEFFSTIVINSMHAVLTEYTNFNFNSYCEFPVNSFLGAGETGVFKVFTGDTDNGDSIDARMEFGITDFSEEARKRLCDGYINYRGDGTLEILVEVDEQDTPDIYNVIHDGDMKLHNYRFKTSKFREGRNWRFIITNKDGSNLDINEIALFYDILSRRM